MYFNRVEWDRFDTVQFKKSDVRLTAFERNLRKFQLKNAIKSFLYILDIVKNVLFYTIILFV